MTDEPLTVPKATCTLVWKLQASPLAQEGVGLQIHSLRQWLASAGLQHLGQGIIDRIRLTKPDDGTLSFRDPSLRPEKFQGLGTDLDTPPFSGCRHTKSRIAHITATSSSYDVDG